MTLEDAFLADIREHPDDDAPRLIYADWLDDHGDPDRAAFVRAQIAQARLPPDDPRQVDLARQVGSLLEQYQAVWRGQLPALPGVYWEEFSRGFVDSVYVSTVGAWLEHGDAIVAAAPVRRMKVERLSPTPAALLARSPHLARLSELNLSYNSDLGRAGVRAIAESPHVANLAVLLLHYSAIGDEAVEELVQSPYLGKLRELYLSGNELGNRSALALARSPALPALVELDLRDNRLTETGARALAYHGHPRLETLWLVNNSIVPEGAWALAGTQVLPALAHLYVNYNPIGDEGAIAFACSTNRQALRELDLRHCGIRERGAHALADSPYLEGLELLWLGGNRLRWKELERLRRRFGERLRI